MTALCDKCRTKVPDNNDAVLLEAVATAIEDGHNLEQLRQSGDLGLLRLTSGARHLLPVEVDGETICPGSPSRAQFIEGQPLDARGSEYSTKDEARLRAAFEILRTLKEDFIGGQREEKA